MITGEGLDHVSKLGREVGHEQLMT